MDTGEEKKIFSFIALNRRIRKINPSMTAKSSGFQKLFKNILKYLRREEKKIWFAVKEQQQKKPSGLSLFCNIKKQEDNEEHL